MTERIEHIFLDMDGVLTDFSGAALEAHGRLDLLEHWPLGEADFPTVLEMSHGDFWKTINARGLSFWTSLEPYPWFEELVGLVAGIAPYTVLTSAALSPDSVAGKVLWLYEHFSEVNGKTFRNFLIGDRKELLARPGRVLIDDTEAKVDSFRAAGGRAILFPQIWNRNHSISDPMTYVRSELARLSS